MRAEKNKLWLRWHRGRGLTVKVDGREAARSDTLGRVRVKLGFHCGDCAATVGVV